MDPVTLAAMVKQATSLVEAGLANAKRTAAEPPRVGPWHEAAAVLGSFLPDGLQLLDDRAADDDGGPERLLADSRATTLPNGERGWTLSPPIRSAALRELRESGRLERTLARNPAERSDRLGCALQAYIAGRATKLDQQQELAELVASQEACELLRAAGFRDLPSETALRQRVDWLTLLEPFQHLAGRYFRGRVEELQRLRKHAGVQAPKSLRDRGQRLIASWGDSPDQPLLIYGPGGVGKSTLLGRFILDHAHALEAERFPFAYLDFDRADVDGSEPLTLLVEAVRQLAIAYPHAYERAEAIRRGWLDLLRKGKPPALARAAAVRDFAILIDQLGAEDRPVLFVLDTFEEVQNHSLEWVDEIWELLDELKIVSRLRVCIAGRARITGHEVNEMPLTEFDEEAAVGYLDARGVTDTDLARRFARRFGRTPLTLRLLADLVLREGGSAVKGSEPSRFTLLRADEEVIQRQLYERILGHIQDPDVRRLARLGLLARRVTPELILEVLARPCGLAVFSLGDARALFDALEREVSLVTVAADGALEHIDDVRKLVLGLLVSDDPDKARAIDEGAVAYYERRPLNPRERAEEIYHRLRLGQPTSAIDARWLDGVGLYLTEAVEEFSGARRAYLASRLGLVVDPETQAAADLEDWERITESRARRLLDDGKAADALALMRARSERSLESRLTLLEVISLGQLRAWEEAARLLDDTIAAAIDAGLKERALRFTLAFTELALIAPEFLARAEAHVTDLDPLAVRPQDRLALTSHALALARAGEKQAQGERLDELRAAFDAVDDDVLIESPRLARWAAWSFTEDDVARLSRVLRLIALPREDQGALRVLANCVATFDHLYSTAHGQPAGALAVEARVPMLGSLTESWGVFLSEVSEAVASDTVRWLLDAKRVEMAPLVPRALATLMGGGLVMQLLDEREAAEATLSAPRSQRSVPAAVLRDIERALTAAFSGADELRRLVRYRLDVSLDAVAPTAGDFTETVRATVAYAQEHGFTAELVAAAREAHPLDAGLLRAAAALGLETIVPADAAAAPAVADFAGFQAQLARIEGQVCRVELAGTTATGFLVASDLVLTADFALTAVFDGSTPLDEVRVLFDYKATTDGYVVTPGTAFGVLEVVAHSPFGPRPDRLGYVLLRVEGAPGAQRLGGEQTESHGALRRWIEVPRVPASRFGEAPWLALAAYPVGGPLTLSRDAHAFAGLSDDGARLYHRLDAPPGAAGGPMFDSRVAPVAFHVGGAGADDAAPLGTAVAVLLSAVLDDLDAKGLGHLLGAVFF